MGQGFPWRTESVSFCVSPGRRGFLPNPVAHACREHVQLFPPVWAVSCHS